MADLDDPMPAIRAAAARIEPFIHRTPVMTSHRLNAMWGADLFFKCEMFQKVGSAKARGALNAVHLLSEDALKNGVVTRSDGNHAIALAMAARTRGTPCKVFMSTLAPQSKRDAAAGYGAEIIRYEPSSNADALIQANIARTGATYVDPADDDAMILGQATAAAELLAEVPDLDIVVCPVGGGALLGGTALATKALSASTDVYAAEPPNSNDAWQSFATNQLVCDRGVHSVADALTTPLSDRTFRILRAKVDAVLLANETTIFDAMQILSETLKVVVEPAAAVPFAGLMELQPKIAKRMGVILSGGNVDLGLHGSLDAELAAHTNPLQNSRGRAQIKWLLSHWTPSNTI